MKRDMNELSRIARGAGTHPELATTTAAPMTIAKMDEQLGGPIGRPEMGGIRNYKANKHGRSAQLEAWKKVTTEKYNQLGTLGVEALKAQAALIREKFRVEWNHQYAALAERAAVGEMTVVRKLEAVLEAGRDLLFGDRADALEKLQERHTAGQLSDDDFGRELRHLFDRYDRLFNQFVQIVDERHAGVRTAFRGPNNGKGE